MGLIAPITGFLAFLLSFVVAILALLFGLVGLARTSAAERGPAPPRAVAGIVLSPAHRHPGWIHDMALVVDAVSEHQRHHNRLR